MKYVSKSKCFSCKVSSRSFQPNLSNRRIHFLLQFPTISGQRLVYTDVLENYFPVYNTRVTTHDCSPAEDFNIYSTRPQRASRNGENFNYNLLDNNWCCSQTQNYMIKNTCKLLKFKREINVLLRRCYCYATALDARAPCTTPLDHRHFMLYLDYLIIICDWHSHPWCLDMM